MEQEQTIKVTYSKTSPKAAVKPGEPSKPQSTPPLRGGFRDGVADYFGRASRRGAAGYFRRDF
jgi:hypothetical protein